MKAGMLALFHNRIFSIYDYCKDKKFASVEDIRNLDYLYTPYHKLGGNGTGTELYNRVKDLPDRPEKPAKLAKAGMQSKLLPLAKTAQ